MEINLVIALLQAWHFAREALDGPLGARSSAHFIDVGEIARTRHRHAEGFPHRRSAGQLGIRKRRLQILNRLVVVLRKRPGHDSNLDYWSLVLSFNNSTLINVTSSLRSAS